MISDVEGTGQRGRLKIFLGYTSGAGKSFKMLSEGCRRKARGQDVVVGAVQPKRTAEIDLLLDGMEVIPMKHVDGIAAMDVEAILKRHPQVCIVDGLAFDNPECSRHAHRWQDVEELLSAGITVVASINLQYIDQQRDAVKAITGKRAMQTIPRQFLDASDEIELVDAPHEMLVKRSSDILSKDENDHDRVAKLAALRRIALVLTADVVDAGLRRYLDANGLKQHWRTQERILVCVAPGVNACEMIEAGKRVAECFDGELIVACVRNAPLSTTDAAMLETHVKLARTCKARIEMLASRDPIEAIVKFARGHGITQIFAGHSRRRNWWTRLFGMRISQLVRAVPELDVRIFPI
jgi:two-component system sensor histidine kinase KdpD